MLEPEFSVFYMKQYLRDSEIKRNFTLEEKAFLVLATKNNDYELKNYI